MKQVFLSADDFGRSHERNLAIDEAFKKGLIKSAGLIVTGQYLQDAVSQMNRGGYVRNVHCHFNVSGNISGEDSMDKPLTERMKEDSFFCKNGMFRSYGGIPRSLRSVFKFITVYKELVAQYDKFIEVTKGQCNRSHIDFHLWYNLSLPVSIALNIFTWTHRIKSVRYVGIQHEHDERLIYRIVVRMIRALSWNPFVKTYHSSNIDGYISKPRWFEKYNSFELYCHPDFVDGELLDNSVSYFGNAKQLLETNLNKLKEDNNLVLYSWAEERLLNNKT